MTAGDITYQGSGTLPVTSPGEQSTVTLTTTGSGATDIVILTPTNRVRDSRGSFQPYTHSQSAQSTIVRADKDQLPEELTFSIICVEI